mmetsp:Transcript_462/g.1073  ORF Transcript_462/g.1073 Transcript_462/m.1073 type:complete len:410 (+) Transcript_462:198-1427(+)|eukprot:CAMPEP_0206447698 /NCGR_PEP_ID=MMETSP0324_2-20121206/16980_1 /ASSEMBLY_ACC=CAM_ASM_000836 /TAXON_ID=2866 /ORGANISM="Crypthecodinium cohnii, Strain Seligo" /LENGTH=409 /DNA_ID=CAMNT_0053916597 /DNA_START=132 /DNA_END=1361 /DNA_ORIENTATION=-
MGMSDESFVIGMMSLLFLSSMGESYFPDMLGIIGLQAQTNWMFLADALGNMSGVLVPTEKPWKEVPCLKAFVPALCDMSSKIFLLGGIALAGAQVKSILYNSCIVWSALLSRVILNKFLTVYQWFGVAVLIGGLLVKIKLKGSNKAVSAEDEAAASDMIWGTSSILLGCALHSMTNVVNEYYITKWGIPPPKLCCLIGCCSLTIWLSAFGIGYIIPEIQKEKWLYLRSDFFPASGSLWAELSKSQPDVMYTNFTAWLCFFFSSSLHALAYYFLLGSIGNVSLGVMKGLTTVGYVAMSAVLLCGEGKAEKYCMSWPTGISSAIVVLGVLLYTLATADAKKRAEQRTLAPPSHGSFVEDGGLPLTDNRQEGSMMELPERKSTDAENAAAASTSTSPPEAPEGGAASGESQV